MLRDLLAGEAPRVLADRTWYATPALLGAAAYAAAWSAGATGPGVAGGCVALVTGLRVLSLARGWQIPVPHPVEAPGPGDDPPAG